MDDPISHRSINNNNTNMNTNIIITNDLQMMNRMFLKDKMNFDLNMMDHKIRLTVDNYLLILIHMVMSKCILMNLMVFDELMMNLMVFDESMMNLMVFDELMMYSMTIHCEKYCSHHHSCLMYLYLCLMTDFL